MNSVLLTILSILGLFYQALTLNEISFLSYVPNLIIPILIFSHFHLNLNYHTILFFLIGIALDCGNPPLFGVFTLTFMILSYLITLIKDHLDLFIIANKAVLIFICNAVFYIIYSFFIAITYQQKLTSLLMSLLISLVLNVILSIVVISILDFIRMLKLDLSDE